jgi:hypothetical protein
MTYEEFLQLMMGTPAVRSPYQMSKELSDLTGGLVSVRPQMFYNYVGKGYIPSEVGPTGKKQVGREAAAAWYMKYLSKNLPSFFQQETSV